MPPWPRRCHERRVGPLRPLHPAAGGHVAADRRPVHGGRPPPSLPPRRPPPPPGLSPPPGRPPPPPARRPADSGGGRTPPRADHKQRVPGGREITYPPASA